MLSQVQRSLVAFALLSTLVLQCSSTPIMFRDEALTGVRKLSAAHEIMPTTVMGMNYMGNQTDGCDCCLWHCDETKGFFVDSYLSLANKMTTTCRQCEAQMFLNQTTMQCTPCTRCDGATEVVSACTQAEDTVCGACSVQSSDDCEEGKFFVDGASDGVCSVCEDWIVCGDDEYETSAPNATKNRVCTECTVCDAPGETQDGICEGTTDRTCKNCTACSCTGANFCVPCTDMVDTSCTPFTDCAAGTTADNWKTNDDVTPCTSNGCGACGPQTVNVTCMTTKIEVNATFHRWENSPETCKDCTVVPTCADTEYQVPCTAMEDTKCVTATVCTDGFWESTALDTMVNRVCDSCKTICEAGSYSWADGLVGQIIDTPCTTAQDTTCKACTEVSTTQCNTTGAKAEYIKLCDGMDIDTICDTCDTCGEGQYTSDVCTNYSNTVCSSCDTTACPIGEFESMACTMGSAIALGQNRQCGECTGKPTSSSYTTVGTIATDCDWECDADFYRNGTTCGMCPADSSSDAGSTSASDCMCNAGFFMNGTTCAQCPFGSSLAGSTSAMDCMCENYFYQDGNVCVMCLDGMSSLAGSSSAMDCNVAIDGTTPDDFELCYNIPAGAKPVMAMGVQQCTLFAENTTTDMCTRCKVDADCADNEELEGDCTNNEDLQELPACVPCEPGYMKVGTACSDIDECTNMDFMHNCVVGFACANTDGSFVCNDVDECTTAGSCNAGEECSNTVGSFSCACGTGYVNTTAGGCADVNECTEGTHNCDATKDCNNDDGGFTCEVKPVAGKTKIMTVVFQLGGFDKADDVDDDTRVIVQEALATELGVAKSAVVLSFNDARRRRLLAVSVTAAVTVAEDQADALKAKANANDFGNKVADTANAKLPVDKQITVTGLQATVPDPIVDPIDSGAAISGPCHILNVLVALVAAAACLGM